jgi:hypothetical protein
MSSAHSDNLTFSYASWMLFISFHCLVTLARIPNAMLNKGGESGDLCLVPDLREKAFSSSPFRIALGVGLLSVVLILLRLCSSLPVCQCFHHERMLNFVTCLHLLENHRDFVSCSVDVTHRVYEFVWSEPSLHLWG